MTWNGEGTDISLHVDEGHALADVVAYDDDVVFEKAPVFGRRCVVELETVLLAREVDLEDEGLVHVAEERGGVHVLSGAQTPTSGKSHS